MSDLDHSAAYRLARSFIGSAGEPLRLEKRIASIGRFGRAEGESHLSLKIEHSESSALTQDGLSPMRLQSFAHSTLGMKRSNVSDTTVPSAHLNARPLMSRGVGIYFGILSALTFVALLPGAITIGLLLFILPGRALVASGTLLYYSLAVLPGYFIARHLGNRPLAVAVAAICLAAAALLPHYVSGYLLGRVVAYDHSDPPTSFQPRSFELPYPEADVLWRNWQRPENRGINRPPPCTDLCQQLLFKGNVDQVFVREQSDPLADGTMVITKMAAYQISRDGMKLVSPAATAPNQADFFKRKWWRFRLQQRETCPDTMSLVEGEFVPEVVRGRCLLEDAIDSADADAVLSISAPPAADGAGNNERESRNSGNALRRMEADPTTITITERRDGRAIPAEVKTTLVAQYAQVPFYFGVNSHGGGGIPDASLAVATDPFPSSFADPFEMIGRRYHLPIAAIPLSTRFSVPVSEDDRTTVNAILKRDYGANGYMPMAPSRLAASFVNARLNSGQLSQDDIELIGALLKQPAFKLPIDTKLPPSTYHELAPLLQEIFERIADRTDGRSEIVQSLTAMLDRFSAEDIDPYWLVICQEPRNADFCYWRERRTARKK
jgi:hypothetical protein